MKGKVVIITGAGSGIGRAAALLMAKKGATIIVSDLSEDSAIETVQLIKDQHGSTATAIKTDVSDKLQVENLIESTVNRYDRIDSIVNNAGIGGGLDFMDTYSDDAYDQVIAVNLTGVWYCMKAVLPIMKEQKSGSIVNTSSVAGIGAAPQMSAYAASKHGVIGLTKSAAAEYGRYNIRVNAVCPTVIDTPMGRSYMEANSEVLEAVKRSIPMKRFGEAEEVAETIAWLCSDASSFVSGSAIKVDGGMKA